MNDPAQPRLRQEQLHYVGLTPSDRVRLELLGYPDPEGLHPSEKSWRELARKLSVELLKREAFVASIQAKYERYG